MDQTSEVGPTDVATTLNYFYEEPPENERAYVFTLGRPGGGRPRNFELKAQPQVIHDIRGKEAGFTLDTAGFQYVKHESQETEFRDQEAIKTVYYKEIEELLKGLTGAHTVVVFDHVVRRDYDADKANTAVYERPSRRPHVDQTEWAAFNRVRQNIPEERAKVLLKDRFRLINVWRPIKYPVARYPFALVDFRSMDPEKDLAYTKLIRPQGDSEFYLVRNNPKHKWWFMNKQKPDEVALLKNFDTDKSAATLTCHSAFDQENPEGFPQRQSIEVRALCFGG